MPWPLRFILVGHVLKDGKHGCKTKLHTAPLKIVKFVWFIGFSWKHWACSMLAIRMNPVSMNACVLLCVGGGGRRRRQTQRRSHSCGQHPDHWWTQCWGLQRCVFSSHSVYQMYTVIHYLMCSLKRILVSQFIKLLFFVFAFLTCCVWI